MPTFTSPGPIAATVEVAGARVRVTAAGSAETVVLVEPINQASRSEVDRADGSITATTASGAIRIGRMTRPGEADERLGKHRGRHRRGHVCLH